MNCNRRLRGLSSCNGVLVLIRRGGMLPVRGGVMDRGRGTLAMGLEQGIRTRDLVLETPAKTQVKEGQVLGNIFHRVGDLYLTT